MEKSSKRGKIPQHDWPSIIKRYEAGETLASIARTYDCSPPAISYIVSRSRARESTGESVLTGVTGTSEPQLVKGHANEMAIPGGLGSGAEVAETRADTEVAEISIPVEALQTEQKQTEANDLARDRYPREDFVLSEANGVVERNQLNNSSDGNPTHGPYTGQPEGGEARRTLHLSLSQDGAHRSVVQQQYSLGSPDSAGSGNAPGGRSTEAHQQGSLQPGRGSSAHHSLPTNGGAVRVMTAPRKARDTDSFIDQALRERVDGDITAFLAAFDAALAHDTVESRAELRDATDRLLRAGARTRIQLERLEARVPLPSRDGNSASAWRVR
jgi:hypothetical protein